MSIHVNSTKVTLFDLSVVWLDTILQANKLLAQILLLFGNTSNWRKNQRSRFLNCQRSVSDDNPHPPTNTYTPTQTQRGLLKLTTVDVNNPVSTQRTKADVCEIGFLYFTSNGF